MQVSGFFGGFGLMWIFPKKISFNITPEKSQENSHDESVVDDTDDGENIGDEIEGIDQIR